MNNRPGCRGYDEDGYKQIFHRLLTDIMHINITQTVTASKLLPAISLCMKLKVIQQWDSFNTI